jgi:anti-sigma factor (TIGR02949 family)
VDPKMMYCQDCVDLLGDYLDGELTEEQVAALEEHLSYCPPCVTFVRTYKATTRVARRHLAHEMPEELGARLHDFLRQRLGGKQG